MFMPRLVWVGIVCLFLFGCGTPVKSTTRIAVDNSSQVPQCASPLVADFQLPTTNPQPNVAFDITVTASGCLGLYGVSYSGLTSAPLPFSGSKTISLTLPSGTQQILVQVFAYDASSSVIGVKNIVRSVTVGVAGEPIAVAPPTAFSCLAVPERPQILLGLDPQGSPLSGPDAIAISAANPLDTRTFRIVNVQAQLQDGTAAPLVFPDVLPSPAKSAHLLAVQFIRPGLTRVTVSVALVANPGVTYNCQSLVEVQPVVPVIQSLSLNDQATLNLTIDWDGAANVKWTALRATSCTLYDVPAKTPLATGLAGTRPLGAFSVSFTSEQTFSFELVCTGIPQTVLTKTAFVIVVRPRPDKVTNFVINGDTVSTYRLTYGLNYQNGYINIMGWGEPGQGGRASGSFTVVKAGGNYTARFNCESPVPGGVCHIDLPGVWGLSGSRVPLVTALPGADSAIRNYVSLANKSGVLRWDCGFGGACINVDTRQNPNQNGWTVPTNLSINYDLF